jgi:uncharacterized protein with von Willebrand factor type A (vWA) domain
MAAHIATLQQRLGVALRGNLINCWFVLDNSGSMAGQKWNLARYQVYEYSLVFTFHLV